MAKTRILIVDDEPALAQMLAAALERAGFEPAAAKDGAEGLAAFRDGAFDVVITDIIMPDREGFETIRDIRALSRQAVIIGASGCGRLDPGAFRDIAVGLGADAFMAKPFRPSELVALIRAKLEERANAVTV